MEHRKIIFIAGAHGTGKGYICEKLAPIIGGEHVTASGLIQNRKTLGKAKAIAGIDTNQSILVEELEKIQTLAPYILLDGHFCLFNTNFEIQVLPISLFRALNINYILLLTCSPQIVVERLHDREKGESDLSLSDSESLQNAEVNQAHKVSSAVQIPLTEYDTSSGSTADIIDALVETIKGI